jgi:hypothetical protein
MQGKGGNVILLTLGTVIAAAGVAVSVLSGGGNEIGHLLYYVMVGSGVLGCVLPRFSLVMLILQITSLDLLKRMLVFAGKIGSADLIWVLGIAPVTMTGIFIGTFIRLLTDERLRRPGDLKRLLIVVLINVLLSVLSFANGSSIGSTMKEVANNSVYSMLLFVVPVLLRDTFAVVSMLRVIVICFVPVALYGLFQLIYGFQGFEIEYLKRGLSIEIKQLMTDRVRPFSTLNSPTALGSVCGILAGFCFFMAGRRSSKGRTIFPPMVAAMLGMVYLVGVVASTSRTEIMLFPVIGLAVWAFPSQLRTRALYVLCVLGFIILVLASPWIINNLEHWTRSIYYVTGGNPFLAAMSTVGTYYDRLKGFSDVLLNPAAWTLFGHSEEVIAADYFFHDPISSTLLRFGVAGLLVVGGGVTLLLRGIHQQIAAIQDAYSRRLAATLVGMVFCVGLCSALSGSRFGIFPINTLIWFLLGCVPVIYSHDRRANLKHAQASAPIASEPKNVLLSRPVSHAV